MEVKILSLSLSRYKSILIGSFINFNKSRIKYAPNGAKEVKV
jgi:hypothetical protein